MSRSGVQLANHPVREAAQRGQVNPTLIVQRAKGWIKIREEGACRMCQRPHAVRPLTRHHIVPQHWFRQHPKLAPLRHADANIVPLCTRCHRDVERSTPHARTELRRLLCPSEIAFALQTAGRVWLDRRYPSGRPPRVDLAVASSPGRGAKA